MRVDKLPAVRSERAMEPVRKALPKDQLPVRMRREEPLPYKKGEVMGATGTFKHCYGCGEMPRHKRPVDGLCEPCNQLLEDGKKYDACNEKLFKIKRWCEAYPIDIFPEPDLKKADKVLKENGISLSAISAFSMRHVLKGVQKIIND